ncbi:signal peptidase II [Enterocloster asparagiformis]|uniref:signal peptidase II n=1 Tax=Enterocloster asparagiformis TaxID=333367 RepID=UPI002A8185AF|nr:signal peptidase II [Enterocloster asparagiformis]
MKQKRSFFTSFLIGFVILVGLDQWTKGLAVKHLMNQPPFVIWDGVFELLYSENRGAAFGMMQGKQFFFFLIALVVLAAVVYLLWKMPVTERYMPMAVCLMMVSAGAVGNMIDRIGQGYVVDFLYFKLINFPIFNVADCYVTISAFLLILLVFFYYREEEMVCFSLHKKEEKSE